MFYSLRASYGRLRSFLQSPSSLNTLVSRSRKLHLGCGGNILPGWLNTDYYPWKWGVYHLDLTKPFQINSESVDFIFCEHVIEHFEPSEILFILREVYRLLSPSGVARIILPTAELIDKITQCSSGLLTHDDILLSYINEMSRLDDFPFDSIEIKADLVKSRYYREWGHKFIGSPASFIKIATWVGFQVNSVSYSCSSFAEFRNIGNAGRMTPGFVELESSCFELQKPSS